jgi:NADH-ubiquinone oxidoreductase chain 5
VLNDLVYFIEWNVITLNSRRVAMTFCLIEFLCPSWASFFICALVMLCRDDYTHGDLNINRFILLVLIYVLSVMLLTIRPNIIKILLGWDGLGLFFLLSENYRARDGVVS